MTTNENKMYIPVANKNIEEPFILALTIPDNLHPVKVTGCALSWTLEALAKFELIKKSIDKKYKNLPYASLRGLLQIYLDTIVYLDREVNLKYTSISDVKKIKPFAYLSESNLDDKIEKKLRTCFNEWIVKYLRPFVKKDSSITKIVDELDKLLLEQNLITITPISSQILPWKWSNETQTTTPPNPKYSFTFLIDFIAKQIAGKEIFTECGTMKRIISANSSNNYAELMTDPISISGKEGKFSLVISLEIITFPSVHQPVLKIDVSKRRWLYNLTDARYGLGNIKGYIFSNDYSDRAFQYTVLCENKEKKWQWNIEQDFEPLRRKFNINSKVTSGQHIIALGKANSDKNQVMLTFHYGISEKYDIEDGVPEIDKIEAFEKISEILKSTGFITFANYEKVAIKHPQTGQVMINPTTLLGAMLENLTNNTNFNFTPQYFSTLSEEQQKQLLQQYFKVNLSDIYINKEDDKSSAPIQKLEKIITFNAEGLEKIYPDESLKLIIFYEADLQTDLNFVSNIAKIIWGKKVKIDVHSLPKNVHGARENLPDKNLKAKERSQSRIKQWNTYTQQLQNQNQRTFCLILAKKWYGNKPDDSINKPSTRKALAAAGCAVQFLLPIEISKEGRRNLSDYFHRVQSALKDLFLAHSGYPLNISGKELFRHP